MEECESISTKLAILYDGQFRCIGETNFLIETFGQGYLIFLKISLRTAIEERWILKRAIYDIFGSGCQLIDEHFVSNFILKNKQMNFYQFSFFSWFCNIT